MRTFATTQAFFFAFLSLVALVYQWVYHTTTSHMSPALISKTEFFSIQVGCMQVIPSWHKHPQQLMWSALTMLGLKACGAPSMSLDTTNREAAGSSHLTPQSVHATSGQCMCMKRCWGSTGQRWSKSFFFFDKTNETNS